MSSFEMDTSKEYKKFIEKAVKESLSYTGNEDLEEDFINSALNKAEKLINIEDDEVKKEFYLNKAVSVAVGEVLKAKGRFKNAVNEEIAGEQITEQQPAVDYSYPDFEIPDTDCARSADTFSREDMEKINKIIHELDTQDKDKNYYKLFYLKYIEEMPISEIVDKTSLSSGEISKRLSELSYKIVTAEQEV